VLIGIRNPGQADAAADVGAPLNSDEGAFMREVYSRARQIVTRTASGPASLFP
jgi:hypothetical protein